MNQQNRKRQNVDQNEKEKNGIGNRSIRELSGNLEEKKENSKNTIGSGNGLEELKLKMAALELNQSRLQEEMKMIRQNQKVAEERAKMEQNEIINKFTQKLASVEEQHRKEIAELKAKRQENYKAFYTLKDAQQKANDKMETSIQMVQQKVMEFGAEMAILKKEQQQEKETANSVESKVNILWTNLAKGKRLVNPRWNYWNSTNTKATIYPDGLNVYNGTNKGQYIYAKQGFAISGQHCRKDHFPGTLVYYFEINQMSLSHWAFCVGLSNGDISGGESFCAKNLYVFPNGHDHCWLSGRKYDFEWPTGAIKPNWNHNSDVIGCGIFVNPANKVFIFFTGNGTLLGKKIPIYDSTNRLFPTINIGDTFFSANFGDNSLKPFKYNIEKCPGLVFESDLAAENIQQ